MSNVAAKPAPCWLHLEWQCQQHRAISGAHTLAPGAQSGSGVQRQVGMRQGSCRTEKPKVLSPRFHLCWVSHLLARPP